MARKPTETVQINLRIRESLRRRLEHEARKANRSLNAEMIEHIESAFQHKDLAPQIKALNAISGKLEKLIRTYFQREGTDADGGKDVR